MMMHSLDPAMNIDSAFEGRLKCRVARKGESRFEGSSGAVWLNWRPEVVGAEAELLASSGCFITTHTYR